MSLLASMDWIAAGAGLVAGMALGWGWKLLLDRSTRRRSREEAECRLTAARREAEALQREARLGGIEEAARLRREAEVEIERRRADLDQIAGRLTERESLLNRHLEALVGKEQSLQNHQRQLTLEHQALTAARQEAEAMRAQRLKALERVAELSVSEARFQLLAEIEREIRKDASDLTRHIIEEARAKADREARRIISLAIQRFAGSQTYDLTTAAVSLNGATDIKGRIIGRDGRNIRAFESVTGVTVLIDDTPNTVVLSGFDPVRREIARRSMELLVVDGRIHPTRIEEVVAQVKGEVEQAILEAGEAAVHQLGLAPLPDPTVRLLGRLRYRQSFSQNILDHSVEVAHLAGLMAAELGASVATARRAGLLHDIGKAVNHEVEGSHALIGAEFLRQHGESDEVVNAVAAHHDEVPPAGLIAVLVAAADALSASRPGARSESMTHYLRRLESLERIGASFAGVEKCYAVQAGRELRVIACPETCDDEKAEALARRIARKIENELQYPGQIRVTVVREKRCIEFAK